MLPSELISSIPDRFEQARVSGDLIYFPSTISEHVESGIKFRLTLCPALQKKSQSSLPDSVSLEREIADPFAPPYNPQIHLGDLQDRGHEYALLLNKFSVVPGHVILAPKVYQSQSSPLLPSELLQVYILLIAAKNAGRTYVAFYNCGDNSGASQPHKHIQLIPVGEDDPPFEALARNTVLEVPARPFSIATLPYANHVCRLPNGLSAFSHEKIDEILSSAFLLLLDLTIATIRHDPDYPPGRPSYNVVMTLEHMHMIPRREESYVLSETGNRLAVNSLGYAGMFLVKSDEELRSVVKEGIGKILRTLGLKRYDHSDGIDP